jgi:hypothetical protein
MGCDTDAGGGEDCWGASGRFWFGADGDWEAVTKYR